jgi:hypothetical protein
MQVFPPAKLVTASKAAPGALVYIGSESSWGFAAGKAGIISLSKMQVVNADGVADCGTDFRVQWDTASASMIADLNGLSRGALCLLATFEGDDLKETAYAVFLGKNNISGTFYNIGSGQQTSRKLDQVFGLTCKTWSIWVPDAGGEYTEVWNSPKPTR